MKTHHDLSDIPAQYGTWLLLLLAVLIFMVYSNTLTGPFIFDDRPNIQNNAKIKLTRLSLAELWEAGFESYSKRPVSNISFALNYYLNGYNVVGYHFVNILIHIINSVLLYSLAKTTLNTPALRRRYDPFAITWIPILSAFIWGLHPLLTQSVSYIVQRMNSLATLFYILALLLYAKGRLTQNTRSRRWLLAGCAASSILAFGSKEITATLPFFIILYEWYFLGDNTNFTFKNKNLLLIGAFFLVILLALLYMGMAPLDAIMARFSKRDFTVDQRMLTELRVVVFYISLIFWPHPSRLNLDHDFNLSHSLMDPITTLFALIAIVGAIAAAIYLAKKAPLISFGISWFLGNLVIESSVIPLEIIFEHRTYLPSTIFILMLVSLAFQIIRPKWLCLTLLFTAIAALSVGTYQRNKVWASAVALWQDSVSKSARKARPYNNLGVALAAANRIDEALKMYRIALQIRPNYALAHYNLGYTLAKNGRLDEGLFHFKKSLRLDPNHKEVYNDLAVALIMQGRLNEAIDHLQQALHLSPEYAPAHNNMGIALARQNHLTEAIHHYQEALRIDPEYAEAHNNLGYALQRQGKFKKAQYHFGEALRINPDYVAAQKNYTENQQNLK
ncbi:MAG: tetratricopeptide repeat protein [Desulfobacterales bacterium]|jgi:tetratricopeptide (TPR) repeat protein